MSAAGSTMRNAAARMQRSVSRIDAATADRLFPPEQRAQWPSGYLPASGIAHLLRPLGISFGEVLECYRDIQQDGQHELQRDFASDYTLWSRCVLEDFVRGLDAHRRRRFTRITARDRLVRDAHVREMFSLSPYRPPPPPLSLRSDSPPSLSQAAAGTAENYYTFQPYAATQEYAMLPVRELRSPQAEVHFTTYPQIRNVLHTDFDSMTAVRGLQLYAGDDIVYTREMVQALALYLNERLAVLQEREQTFLNGSSDGSVRFSMDTPVLVFFGNGRLAWMLNESGLLSPSVRAVQLPRQAAQHDRRHSHLMQMQQRLKDEFGFHETFSTIFPCETLSVGDALRKYRPAIAIVEPHIDRDYFCDLRGFYSVREVLAMGPIDSPAMGSFAFPFLSFGATPGPTTYWTYNGNLHRVQAAERIQMPMDAPYASQGYERHYVDEISAYLIAPNDCPVIGQQFRCLSFRRVRPPMIKADVAHRLPEDVVGKSGSTEKGKKEKGPDSTAPTTGPAA